MPSFRSLRVRFVFLCEGMNTRREAPPERRKTHNGRRNAKRTLLEGCPPHETSLRVVAPIPKNNEEKVETWSDEIQ